MGLNDVTAPPPRVPPPPGAPPPPPGPGGAGPTAPPPPFWRISRLIIPDAEASPTSQVATYLVAAYAVGMVAYVTGETGTGVAIALILLAGAVIGATTGASRWFRQAPGIVLGVIASLLTLVALGVFAAATGGVPGGDGRTLAVLVVGVGFFVAGLDWTRVGRLRAVPALAALPVLLVSISDDGPMLAVSLAWLALAVAALWSLEIDQRAAFADPQPLTARTGGNDIGSRDLAGALGLALLLGLLFAFSASMPSCSPNIPGLNRIPGLDRLDFGDRDVGSGRSFNGGWLSIENLRFGDFPFDFSGEVPTIDIDGVRYLLREGASGMLYLEDVLTGERFALRPEGENLVARDAQGNIVAVIRPEEEKEPSDIPWATILGVVALTAVAGLAWWWYRKHRKPPSLGSRQWAEDLAVRIERFGRSHGVPRSRSQTVVHHSAVLTEKVAPDPRLDQVARVISDALFGHEQPTMERRIWAEQVVDEIVTAHPPPSRLERRRRKKQAPAGEEGEIDPPAGPGTPETIGTGSTIERP